MSGQLRCLSLLSSESTTLLFSLRMAEKSPYARPMLRGCRRHMSGGCRLDFPMAPLPGVVRQNMADFHSNPLDWDTVQLSLSVCSEKAPHYSAFQSRRKLPLPPPPPSINLPGFSCSRGGSLIPRSPSGEKEGKNEEGIGAPPCSPVSSLLAPNSSCIFMTHKAVQSSAERADVGLWVGVSRQTTPHKYLYPQPVE